MKKSTAPARRTRALARFYEKHPYITVFSLPLFIFPVMASAPESYGYVMGVYLAIAWTIAVVLVPVFLGGRSLWRRKARTTAQRRALIARADYEHGLVLQGNERGVYGQYPPYGKDSGNDHHLL